MQNIFFVNDSFIAENEAFIKATDLGLLRGYGVFDFFRAIDGKILFLHDHLVRFSNSAKAFGLNIPYTHAQLQDIIEQTVAKNPSSLLGIKLVLTGGYSPDGYTPTQPNFVIIAKPFSFLQKAEGMHLYRLEHVRELPEVKSLNYMVPIYHLPKMKAMGADDYLYHKDGLVSELSRSNVFVVKNEKIITPNSQILRGITRQHVLTIAQKNWEVEERAVTLKEVLSADEIFTTGSTKRIVSITKIDQKPVGSIKRPITDQLLQQFLTYEKTH